MEKKPKLPEGWIEQRSTKYPDREYYFNINTGNSSWEYPDVILTEQVANTNRAPATPQGKDRNDRNLQTKDIATNNKKRLFKEDTIKSPAGKGGHELRTSISNEPSSKKRKISPIKFPSGQCAKGGVKNVPNVVAYGKKSEDLTRNLKHAFNDKSKEMTVHAHLNRNQNARGDVSHQDTARNSVKSLKTQLKNESVEIAKDKYPFVSFLPQTTIQVMQQVRSPANHAPAKSGPNKLADLNQNLSNLPTEAASKNKIVITREDLDSVRTKKKKGTVPSGTGKVFDAGKKQSNENDYEYNSKRKVVNSLQRATLRRERTVKAMNGKQLRVETLSAGKPLQEECETAKEKPIFRLDNESPGTDSLEDSDNEGKMKQFIGNKEKLLRIQSWIDNIQEGSDSPRIEFYNDQFVSQDSAVNQSTDSGFLSPSIKTERGWPGTLKSSLVSSRNLVEMDVEMSWELPEVDTTRVEEQMDVDIDEVISEVRQIVKAQTERKKKSAKKNWEPAFYENQIFQSVVIVVDTCIFINNLHLVEQLKDYDIPDKGKPTLFIPWVVLQELDVIKESSSGKHKSIQNKARKAIWLLKSFFSKKLANVKGQTPRQDDEASREFQSKCNDDSILQAALQCQKLYVHCEVILLTDDNNLSVKSFINKVAASSSKEIHERLEKMKPNVEQKKTLVNKIANIVPLPYTYDHTSQVKHSRGYSDTVRPAVTSVSSKLKTNCDNITVPSRQTPVPQQSRPSLSSAGTLRPSLNSNKTYQSDNYCDNKRTASHAGNYNEIPLPRPTQIKCMADTLLQEEKSCTLESLCEDIYRKLTAVLKEGFGKVLEEEMKLSFDDLWLQIVYRKPPWSFIDILECWKKHSNVFGLVLKRSLKANVERLVCYFHSKRSHTIEFMFEICKDSLEILRDCVNVQRYGDTMFGIKECVLCLYELCEGLIGNSITVQSISSLNDYLKSKLVPDKTGSVCSSHQSPPHQMQSPNRHAHVSGNIRVSSPEQHIPHQTSYSSSQGAHEQNGPNSEYIQQSSSSHYASNTQTLNNANAVSYTLRDQHGPSSVINSQQNNFQNPYSVNTPQQASHTSLPVQNPYHGNTVINTPGHLNGYFVINTPGNFHGNPMINSPGQHLHENPVRNSPGHQHTNSVMNTPGHIHENSLLNSHGNSVINTAGHLHRPNVINATRPVSHNLPDQLPSQNIQGPYLINTVHHSGQTILPTHQPFNANAVFNSPENIHLHIPNDMNQIHHISNINKPVPPGHASESIQQPTGYTHPHLQISNEGLVPESIQQPMGYNTHPHPHLQIPNEGLACEPIPQEKPGDVIAGELLQQIWEFIFASCNKIADEMSRCNTEGVGKMLHQIVPVAKDLRVVYVCLLEVPIPELSVHEDDFTKFTDLCNSFFFRCGEQVPIQAPVTPVGFLMLLSNLAHRETLVNFHARLDDMLRHLYHCLQKVFPDD